MKRTLSFLLAMIVVFGTLSSVTATVYADYDANLIVHQKINYILENFVDPNCLLDNYSFSEVEEAELRSLAEEAIADCTTEYEKISAITRFVAENIYYDYDVYEGRTGQRSTAAYNVWTDKRTICAGYSTLMKALLNLINIPCMIVPAENHAYNVAYDSENDRWIYLDATWCSGNEYRYGEYTEGSYVSYYFDMPLEFLSRLSNHEFTTVYGIVVDDVEYLLETPCFSFDWVNTDEWYIAVTGHTDANNVTSINNIIDSLEGVPLKEIYTYAFKDYTNLVSITIPKGVTTIGMSSFEGCTNLLSITIPDSVTNISDDAFSGCTSLESITLPDSVTSIGMSAFENCTNLTSITIPNGVTNISDDAFSGCTSLESITLPDSVTSIGMSAFENCTNLTSITIPDGVTNIGSSAFYKCTNLDNVYIKDIGKWCEIKFAASSSNPLYYADNFYLNGELVTDLVIPDGITTIPEYAFSCGSLTSITVPDSVTSIERSAFYKCTNLDNVYISDIAKWCGISFTDQFANPLYYADNLYINGELVVDLVIPDGVTSIDSFAFKRCTNLTSIVIPDSVTYIGEEAFSSCRNLISVTIGNSVTTIDYSAFNSCTNLTSITIPDSVINIGSSAFYGCASLESISLPDSVTSIGNDAFSGCIRLALINVGKNNTSYSSVDGILFNKDKTTLILYPARKTNTEYIIPDTVTAICDKAFYKCINLTSIIIPDSVTNIGDSVFNSCTNLIKLEIPEGVTNIDYNAFRDCENLTSVAIPISVTSIAGSAFEGCTSLKYVFYIGSESDWGNITIGYSNENFTGAIIHYNSIDHIYVDWKIIKEATCSETGEKYHICSVCEYAEFVETPVRDHDYSTEWTIDVEPTCTKEGSKSHHCIRCNAKTDITVIDALGHDYSEEWTIDKAATCMEAGSKSHHCSNCDEKSDITVIEVTSHSYGDWVVTLEPTCTEQGLQSKTCSACGVVGETEAIVALGHNYLTEWSVDKEATCTEEGSKSHHCSRCNEKTDIIAIEATGHNYNDWVITFVPTCTEEGLQSKTCSSCGAVGETEAIAALGHNYLTEWSIDKEATCTEEGSKSHHCSRCDEKVDVTVITAIGHSYGDWVVISEPTCIKQGLCGKICSACGDVVGEAISANGHSYSDEWTIDKEATCTEKGSKSHHCLNCDSKTDVTVISATGHSASSWITDTKATVYKAGSKHKECTECGEVLETATIKQLKCSKPKLKTIANTSSGVKITWGKVSGADKYYVYRKVKGGSYSKIGTTSKTYYTDKKAKSGKKYYYIVKAVNEAGKSESSSSKTIKYLADPTLKTPKSTKSGVSLKWTKTTGAQGYIIYRKTGNGSYKKLKTEKGVSNLSYVDKSAKKGKKYTYKVKAYYSKTYSAYSNTKTIKDKY